jgi:hypothetical protein
VSVLKFPIGWRVARKLEEWQSSPRFAATVDVLADIRPRRTNPRGFDIIVTGDNQVFTVFVDDENQDHVEYVGTRAMLEANLENLANCAGLADEERAWLLGRVKEFTHPDLIEEDVESPGA